NITACAIHDAKQKLDNTKNNRIYNYKINFTFALNQLKDNIVRFTMKLAKCQLYELLMSKILKSLSAIRPNRKFVRKERTFVPKKYPMSYKRMC
ncbi:hypothetical protein, partial [Candidatus Colwellia aromaticivorans]|uniref:hypothetical protein n=1 Tax=Candidatus Colwellia aromaticivorans TaxID=2267621 RepID=UPI000DF2F5B5